MRPLKVNTETRRRLRAIEKPLEDDCGDICKEVGRLWLKADATEGWPDRYLGLGYWVEFKATAFNRCAMLYSQLRPEQHIICRQLHESGDNVYVAILLVDVRENKRYVWWQHYGKFAELKKKHLARETILEHAIPYDTFKVAFRDWVCNLKRHLYD